MYSFINSKRAIFQLPLMNKKLFHAQDKDMAPRRLAHVLFLEVYKQLSIQIAFSDLKMHDVFPYLNWNTDIAKLNQFVPIYAFVLISAKIFLIAKLKFRFIFKLKPATLKKYRSKPWLAASFQT